MQATLSERDLIQVAINQEKTSFALYSRAAVQAGSEKVKKVFNRIARDELVHLFILLSRFERIYPELCNEVNIVMPIPDAYSAPNRPVIPGQTGHPIRYKPATVPEQTGHPPYFGVRLS